MLKLRNASLEDLYDLIIKNLLCTISDGILENVSLNVRAEISFAFYNSITSPGRPYVYNFLL